VTLKRPNAPARRVTATAAAKQGDAGRAHGLGEGSSITVKGARATSAQRAVIDGCLSEAKQAGASQRVMVAVVMAITQESGASTGAVNGSHIGPFQQDPAWGSSSDRTDPEASTRLFLRGGKAGQSGWQQTQGGLKAAPGDLSLAIEAVQRSGRPSAYAQWETEATATVKAWLGSDGFGTSATTKKRYTFTRGERGGQREDSWEATGRLAEEVGRRRWAAGNVFGYASDEELRAAAPSLVIHGDEGWLLSDPEWDWGQARAVSEVTLRVAADRWGVMPGGVVIMATGGVTDGRFEVKSVSGARLDSPEADVVLIRPTRSKAEPPAEAASDSGAGSASGLRAACQKISDQHRAYLFGGGHKALSAITDHEPLDCSSAVSLALWLADMFPGSAALTSGALAAAWGKAGKGQEFTVWANDGHCWIEAYDGDGKFAWRFDTRPVAGEDRGPRVRTSLIADQGRFSGRHWAGH
jgi:hypothetical protein